MENVNKEIDLVKLFIKVLLHIKKYKWIFIASIIIGFSIAYTVSKFSTKLYKSHITVITNDNKGVLISLFESLGEVKNTSGFYNILNVSNETSKKIVEIVPEAIILESEEDVEPNIFKIYVTLTDPSIFKDVEKGLQYFAENNSHLKNLNQINNSQRNDLINYIDIEIKKFNEYRLNNRNRSNIYIYDGTETQNEMISLFEKKQKLEKANKVSEIFNIVKGFDKVKKPINSFTKLVLIYVFLILLLGFLLSIHLELRKYFKKKELL